MKVIYREFSAPPWSYLSDPPYRVIAIVTSQGRKIEIVRFDHLADAVQHFIRFHVGPMEDRSVTIADSNDQLILGYRVEFRAEWFGTAAGFEALAEQYDPMSVAVWEVEARGGNAPNDVPVEENWLS